MSADRTNAGRFTRAFAVTLLIATAVAIPVGLVGPAKPDTEGYSDATDEALSDARLNEITASGAPQQQVVNGWLNRDLQMIQIAQNNDLLLLMHLAVAMGGAVVLAAVIAGLVTFKTAAVPLPVVQAPVVPAPASAPTVDPRPSPPTSGQWKASTTEPPTQPPPLPPSVP